MAAERGIAAGHLLDGLCLGDLSNADCFRVLYERETRATSSFLPLPLFLYIYMCVCVYTYVYVLTVYTAHRVLSHNG